MSCQRSKRIGILMFVLFLMLLLCCCAQAEVNAKDIEWETAKSLGWIDDTAQPDEPCGKDQFYTLMDAMVKQRTGTTCEWFDWGTGDPMQRLYVPRVLYEAALNMGYSEKDSARQDIANINDVQTMMNSIDIWLCGEQWRGIDICPDYEEFCNDSTGTLPWEPDNWRVLSSWEFCTFAAKQECFVNGMPVMELTEDGRFRPYDAITMEEAVSAALRLYCSFGDYTEAKEVYGAVEYDILLASAVKIQFSSENLGKEVRLQLGLEQDEPVYDFMLEELGLTELNGMLTEEVWNAAPITARGLVAMLDDFVEDVAEQHLGEWKAMFPAVRESNIILTRADGICLIYGAAFTACPEKGQLGERCMNLGATIGEKAWDEYQPNNELFGALYEIPSPWHNCSFDAGAYFFSLDFCNPYNEMMFEYDPVENTTHTNVILTQEDARHAVNLLKNDWASRYVDLDDPDAVKPSIDEDTLRLANETEITSFDELSRLTGFVLNSNTSADTVAAMPDQLDEIASWGFTSVRIMASYETFFSKDASQVNLTQLSRLDALVETAIKNHLHLNFLLVSLPGRTPVYFGDHQYGGEFDMFVNPAKLELAAKIWHVIAERYKDVPGAYLSFTPFCEADNANMSTGAEAPAYTAQDISNGLEIIVKSIREADPDRYIMYEVTSSLEFEEVLRVTEPSRKMMKNYDNVRIAFNYGKSAYIYAGMNAAPGENIDNNNHSAFASEYPVTIYGARNNINSEHPITIDGCLPAGTKLELYLSASGEGQLTVSSEKEMLYQEELPESQYQVLSQLTGWYPYGTSDKLISVTLQEDAEHLTLLADNWLSWLGMDITLPEQYAVDRWYNYTAYDADLDGDESKAGSYLVKTSLVRICPAFDDSGENLTIHDDVTYTSDAILDEANARTIGQWGENVRPIAEKATVRFESAMFTNTDEQSALRYYDDFLSVLDACGYDWYSNDYDVICHPDQRGFLGSETCAYGRYEHFDLPLLQLLQKHQ